MLTELLGPVEGREAFSWLRGLSFIEHGLEGIFPHDLVRDVLDADLRWRDPEAYRRLHKRLRARTLRRFQESTGIAQQRVGFELLFLHRNQPLMRPYYDWTDMGSTYAESFSPRHRTAILGMVHRHEGQESAQISNYWLDRQPRAFVVFRDARDPEPVGFIASLMLSSVTPNDLRTDPAIRHAWEYVQRYGLLRSSECILYHRFWIGRDQYQVPAVHNLTANVSLRMWLTTPHLAWTFACAADPNFWEPMFAYLNFRRVRESDFQVGGQWYSVFAHDWRIEPTHAWLETMGNRHANPDFRPEPAGAFDPAPLIVLPKTEFVSAVRRALREYMYLHALADNPLLRSRVVRDRAGPAPGPETLRSLLREAAAAALRTSPKDEKLYRAVYHTYFKPSPTQEAAAELLALPFSTYRFHLRRGIDRIANWLWEHEVYGPDIPFPTGT